MIACDPSTSWVTALPDVVEEGTPLRDRRIEPELGGEGARDVRRLHEVLQDVLPVGGAVLQAPEQPDHLGMDVGDPHLRDGIFTRAPDPVLELAHRSLVDLLDPCGMDPPVLHQLLEGHPRRLAADGVEARQDHGLGGVVDDHVHPRRGLEGPDVASLAADDPTLHVLAREREDADGRLRRLF